MLLPWSKPPHEITCPVCGAKVPIRQDKNRQLQPKPYCDSCGWNVLRARKQLVIQIWQNVILAALLACYGWAVTGMSWSIAFFGGWVLIVMGFPILRHLRRLPPSRPAAPVPPLAGIADFRGAALETITPRLNIIFEGLIVVVSAIAILFVPRELNPAQRRLPKASHEPLFVILTIGFAAYQLGIHGVLFFRLLRQIWLERHLANRAMMAKGRIIESSSGRIRYEFLDYSNRLVSGVGRDYTMGLYEDMPLSVLYDPDSPSLNMPLAGLQFHRQRAASENQPVVH